MDRTRMVHTGGQEVIPSALPLRVSPMPEPLQRFIPSGDLVVAVGPAAFLIAVGAAIVTSVLRRRGLAAPYTRKTFHFIVITVAVGVHLRWGLPGAVVYGSVVAALVLVAVARGDGNPLYEALARPSDAPHQTLFILVPLATTALGGVVANLLFPHWAHIGYMAVAWGDAVGEPVGTRWGRRRFRAPSLAGVAATRSVEGSAAVLIASAGAAAIALVASDVAPLAVFGVAAAVGIGTAAVEVVSHHGLDNFTIQVAAAGIATLLL